MGAVSSAGALVVGRFSGLVETPCWDSSSRSGLTQLGTCDLARSFREVARQCKAMQHIDPVEVKGWVSSRAVLKDFVGHQEGAEA